MSENINYNSEITYAHKMAAHASFFFLFWGKEIYILVLFTRPSLSGGGVPLFVGFSI
jgi:hypothetical protein